MSRQATIYHNPRCSKSRAALALLNAHSFDVTVIEYLQHPPSTDELTALLNMLDLPADQLLRKADKLYQSVVPPDAAAGDINPVALLQENPALLQRPVVVIGDTAVIGRPTERVLDLIEQQ